MRTVRLMPPAAGNNPFVANGRSYSLGALVDMPDCDALVASANGWTIEGVVGSTAQRPVPSDPDFQSWAREPYIDTTLGVVIRYDFNQKVWRNPVTGAAV